MKTIVFIGTQKSGSSREAIRAAEELGYYTVLFTNRETFLRNREEFPDVHLMQLCNIDNVGEIHRSIQHLLARALDICAVVSFTDPYCHTACRIGDELGVNHFSTEAIGKMQDKLLSRQVLSQTPYTPRFSSLQQNAILSREKIEKVLPLIVKSPNSTGSKDVYKASSFKEFKHYFDKLKEKYPESPVLIEEFLDGPQYLVEAVVHHKKVHIIAVIQQEITYYNKHFIVTGYNLMHEMDAGFGRSIDEAVNSIVEKHGMENGTCHLEMRYINGSWKLIEINPRISGGGMNKLIEVGRGINLVKETLKMALGDEPDLKPIRNEYTFAHYVISTKSGTLDKVIGKNKAKNSPGAKVVYVKPRKGAMLVPPTSMGNRYAYVIATGDSEEAAIRNARYSASQIQFLLTPSPEIEQEDRTSPNMENSEQIEQAENIQGILPGISDFKDYLTASGKSSSTVEKYFQELKKYNKWYEDFYGKECSLLEKADIIEYKNYLLNTRKNSSKTINSKLSVLRKLNEFLVEKGIQKEMVLNKADRKNIL